MAPGPRSRSDPFLLAGLTMGERATESVALKSKIQRLDSQQPPRIALENERLGVVAQRRRVDDVAGSRVRLGQSTANISRSMPIASIVHCSALCGNFPPVVK